MEEQEDERKNDLAWLTIQLQTGPELSGEVPRLWGIPERSLEVPRGPWGIPVMSSEIRQMLVPAYQREPLLEWSENHGKTNDFRK